MSESQKKIALFIPLFVGIALALGYYLGTQQNPLQVNKEEKQNLLKLNSVLNYIDKNYVDEVDKNSMVEKSLANILKSLDPHSSYIPAKNLEDVNRELKGSFGGVGIRFMIYKDTLVVTNVIKGGPSNAAGIKPGDRIVAVDNENIAGVKINTDKVLKMLKGSMGTKVEVDILRFNDPIKKEIEIRRGNIPINSINASFMLNNTTGYIKLEQFGAPTYSEFMQASKRLLARGMKRLVFDLRNNGGGYLGTAIQIVDEMVKPGSPIVHTKGRARGKEEEFARVNGILQDIEIVVIINQSSASASEIVSGAIQDNDRGVIIGRRSFGKGLVQEQKELEDGSAFRLTIARYYTPTGRSIQKPYGDETDYDSEIYNRYENGEFYAMDSSLMVDSLKYYTLNKKRLVYGGGGIMPDIFIPLDTTETSPFLSQMRYYRVMDKYVFNYLDYNRAKLLEMYPDYEAFGKGFIVEEDEFNKIIDFSEKQGVFRNEEDIQHSKNLIIHDFKSDLARHLYDLEAYHYIGTEIDTEIQQAIKLEIDL